MTEDAKKESLVPDHLRELFESKSASIVAEFEDSRSEFEHGGLKGDEGEMIVRDFLKMFLPRYYGFGNGQIIDRKGNRSKEVDIAICSPFHPFTYSREGRGILFIEGVEGVVEIKSILNENHLGTTLKNCQSIRQLDPKIPPGTIWPGRDTEEAYTPYFLFTFESQLRSKQYIRN